jgi:hypothetical protein
MLVGVLEIEAQSRGGDSGISSLMNRWLVAAERRHGCMLVRMMEIELYESGMIRAILDSMADSSTGCTLRSASEVEP